MPDRIPTYRPARKPRRRTDTHASQSEEAKERNRFLCRKAWKTLRSAHLAANPLCHDCLKVGVLTPAREVHHIEARQATPEKQYDADNLMSLCSPCHAVRTKRGE
jgi:5-methylcytosine-specific restriction protein A